MNLMDRPKLAPYARLSEDPQTGHPILLYPEGAVELNATATEILRRCQGVATLDEILRDLQESFEVSSDVLRRDVEMVLMEFFQRSLLVMV